MVSSTAVLFSVYLFSATYASPVPQDAPSTCNIAYKVTDASSVDGQAYLSDFSCKNDFNADPNGRCEIGPHAWNQFAVIPLVSQNLKTASQTYNLSQIANDANNLVGGGSIASGQLTGGTTTNYCDGALECGLLVTPSYVHITGTRTFDPACNSPTPSEPFEMYLPKSTVIAVGEIAVLSTQRCYIGSGGSAPADMPACPTSGAWDNQIVYSDWATYPAGLFAKLVGTTPHGSGFRYSIRFNTGNPAFGVAGQTLLTALNDVVKGQGAPTACEGSWQEWSDEMSDVAEFDFDAPDGTSLANTCTHVMTALESISKIPNSGSGVCL